MSKKWKVLSLGLCLSLMLCACGAEDGQQGSSVQSGTEVTGTVDASDNNGAATQTGTEGTEGTDTATGEALPAADKDSASQNSGWGMEDLVGEWQLVRTGYNGFDESYSDDNSVAGTISITQADNDKNYELSYDYDNGYGKSYAYYLALKETADQILPYFESGYETVDSLKGIAATGGMMTSNYYEEYYSSKVHFLLTLKDQDTLLVEVDYPEDYEVDFDTTEQFEFTRMQPVEAITGDTLLGNGTDFVQVGGRVYYRSYGASGLNESALFGHFENGVSNYGYSLMKYYDLSTGQVCNAFVDQGGDGIFYYDGYFYLNKMNWDDGEYSFYRTYRDNGYATSIGVGHIECMDTKTGCYAVTRYDEDYSTLIDLYLADQKLAIITIPAGDSLAGMDMQNGWFVFYTADYDENYDLRGYQLYSYDLPSLVTNSQSGKVGTMRMIGELEPYDEYGYDTGDSFIIRGNTVYSLLSSYAGSMNIFNGGRLIKASLKEEGSIEVIEEIPYSEGGEAPVLRWKQTKPVVELPSEIEGYSPSSYFPAYEDEESPIRTYVEDFTEINGCFYAVVNKCLYDPINDVGWRESYLRLRTDYVRIDKVTGEQKILSSVNRENVIYPAEVIWDSANGKLMYSPKKDDVEEETYFLGVVELELADDFTLYSYDDMVAEIGEKLGDNFNYRDVFVKYLENFNAVGEAKSAYGYLHYDYPDMPADYTPVYCSLTIDSEGKIKGAYVMYNDTYSEE